ncbi:MAG: hypothetical protein PVF68_12070 [Acidobacteriota bacterium]
MEDAARLGARDLRRAVAGAYDRICAAMRRLAVPFPIRMWSFLPGIHGAPEPGIDRYMVFNAGRHDALAGWCGGPDEFERVLPASTAVGVVGPDLRIYCLASREPGRPVENPRQRPAYRYTRRYGPLPPCFARATLARIGTTPCFLISGTASVLGEDSRHVGSLSRQLAETLANMEALLTPSVEGFLRGRPRPGEAAALIREVRAYHARRDDGPAVGEAVRRRFPNLERLELVQAAICRSELEVEIEALAHHRTLTTRPARGATVPGRRRPGAPPSP